MNKHVSKLLYPRASEAAGTYALLKGRRNGKHMVAAKAIDFGSVMVGSLV